MSTLRERIIELLNTAELADPREIAEKLLPELDDDEREEALRSILPGYVREIIRATRFGGCRWLGHHGTRDRRRS